MTASADSQRPCPKGLCALQRVDLGFMFDKRVENPPLTHSSRVAPRKMLPNGCRFAACASPAELRNVRLPFDRLDMKSLSSGNNGDVRVDGHVQQTASSSRKPVKPRAAEKSLWEILFYSNFISYFTSDCP